MSPTATRTRLVSPAQLAVAVHAWRVRAHQYGDDCPPSCREATAAIVDDLYATMPPNEVLDDEIRVDRRDEVLRVMPEAKVALLRLTGQRVALKDAASLLWFDVSLENATDVEYGALLRVSAGYTALDLGVGQWVIRRASEDENEAIRLASEGVE